MREENEQNMDYVIDNFIYNLQVAVADKRISKENLVYLANNLRAMIESDRNPELLMEDENENKINTKLSEFIKLFEEYKDIVGPKRLLKLIKTVNELAFGKELPSSEELTL